MHLVPVLASAATGPVSPQHRAWPRAGSRRAMPRGLAAAGAAVAVPLGFVLACEAAGLQQLGYTRSLVLFLVPVALGAAWLLGGRRIRAAVHWRALAATVGAWTCLGWLLDLALAATFFRFPEPAAVCGICLPGLDLANGSMLAVPVEEFAFYLLGFLVAIVAYLWFDRCAFPARRKPMPVRAPRPRRLQVAILALGALALAVAWASKGGVPGYALFLVVAVVVPNAWLLPTAWPRVNQRALAATMVVLVVLAAIWEVTLALPNGWWAYRPEHMACWIATPWANLPVEAIAVWVLWPWTTVVTYEALRVPRARLVAAAPLHAAAEAA